MSLYLRNNLNYPSVISINFMSLFKYICHQKTERCLKLLGKPMPICSRCFGVYSGILMGMILLLLVFDIKVSKIQAISFLIILNVPLVIDGITQHFSFRESNNLLRFITGLIGGVGSSFALFYILNKIFFR